MPLTSRPNKVGHDGREAVQHGSDMFPAACYYGNLKGRPVPTHWHEELELIIVTAGRITVSIGTEKFQLEEGQGLFVNAGTLHAMGSIRGHEALLHTIVFHPRLVGGSGESVFWFRYLRPLMEENACRYLILLPSVDWQQQIMDAIRQAWDAEVGQQEGFEFSVRSALSLAILRLQQNLPPTKAEQPLKALRDEARIKHMLRFIHEHYHEEIDAEQIAASASISKSECLRCFRTVLGMPPVRYLKHFRLQRTSVLLLSTSRSISDIAAACGFYDMSYYAKEFKKMFFCTPSEYRERKEK